MVCLLVILNFFTCLQISHMSSTCSGLVHNLFKNCSIVRVMANEWLVHDVSIHLFMTSSSCLWHFMISPCLLHGLFMDCSWTSSHVYILEIWALLLRGLFTNSSWLIQDLGTTCSWLFHNFFQDLFKTTSELVYDLFMTFVGHIIDLFVTCSWLFHDLFISYPKLLHLFINTLFEQYLFWTGLQLVHNLFKTFSWLAHVSFPACWWLGYLIKDLYMSPSILVHYLFKTCSWPVHDLLMTFSWFVHGLFMT